MKPDREKFKQGSACIEEDEFQLYLEGGLSREDEQRLKKHASSCRLCQMELETWEIVRKTLREVGEVVVPTCLKSRIMEQVAKTAILAKKEPFSYMKIAGTALLSLFLVLYLFMPGFKSFLLVSLITVARLISYSLLNITAFLGLDVTALFPALSAMMGNWALLLIIFSGGTLLLIGAFLAMLIRGRTFARTG